MTILVFILLFLVGFIGGNAISTEYVKSSEESCDFKKTFRRSLSIIFILFIITTLSVGKVYYYIFLVLLALKLNNLYIIYKNSNNDNK